MKLKDAVAAIFLIIVGVIISIPLASALRAVKVPIVD
jgi:hypothetical protein